MNDKPDPWKSHPASSPPAGEGNARRSDRPQRADARLHVSADPSMLAEGSRFGGYLVGPCIGEGGMARVYRAQHEGLQRAQRLLDEYEQLWHGRFERMAELLDEDSSGGTT